MKKSASILFLLLFLYNLIGYNIWFTCFSIDHELEISGALNDQEKEQTIRIPFEEIPFLVYQEGGREVSINGKWYDIKSTSYESADLVFVCVHDDEESDMIQAIDHYFKESTDPFAPVEKQKKPNENIVKDYFISAIEQLIVESPSASYPRFTPKLGPVPPRSLFIPPPELV